MEDSHHFPSDVNHNSFDADSLSVLHTTWLDDEQLNNLPIMDVFADASTPKAQDTAVESLNTTEKTTEQSTESDSVLDVDLGDHDAQQLVAALDFTFDTDLSPILEPFAETTVAMSPLKMQRRDSKSLRIGRTASSPLRRTSTVTTPRQASRTGAETTPLAVTKRPRTRSSSWLEQEQNTFFSMFKVKWPRTPEGEPMPPFSSLLLQRFDAISTKVRTKSVMEVRQFYTTVMQNISELLNVVDNDIDLANPDQVRIAVWCWSKLMADKKHYEEFQALDSHPVSVKINLANVLLQSIIRSRRQMLKAKADNSAPNSKLSGPGLTSISAWVSRSNLSSFFAKGDVSVPEAATAKIHHPMVRKKHSVSQGQVALMPRISSGTENAKKVLSSPISQQPNGESPGKTALKRKRSSSTDCSPAVGSTKKNRRAEVEATTFTSPTPTDKRSRSRTRNGIAFHTPQQSRKKIYIKMRMVPRDKQTKADVVRCGCRPKVELKLSSTKKISEITDHMSKKWAKVRSVLPKGSVLCFFQKNGLDKWSKEDANVTCFDIWKQCGKQSSGENVVEVSYLWKVPERTAHSADDENVQTQDLMPLHAPPGLFEQEMSASTDQALNSGDESEAAQLSPARGLQEFGEKVAFDRSVTAEAKEIEALIDDNGDEDLGEEYSPTTGRLRRRIKPVLVSKEEFNI